METLKAKGPALKNPGGLPQTGPLQEAGRINKILKYLSARGLTFDEEGNPILF